jgi:hypothetical protein
MLLITLDAPFTIDNEDTHMLTADTDLNDWQGHDLG